MPDDDNSNFGEPLFGEPTFSETPLPDTNVIVTQSYERSSVPGVAIRMVNSLL